MLNTFLKAALIRFLTAILGWNHFRTLLYFLKILHENWSILFDDIFGHLEMSNLIKNTAVMSKLIHSVKPTKHFVDHNILLKIILIRKMIPERRKSVQAASNIDEENVFNFFSNKYYLFIYFRN